MTVVRMVQVPADDVVNVVAVVTRCVAATRAVSVTVVVVAVVPICARLGILVADGNRLGHRTAPGRGLDRHILDLSGIDAIVVTADPIDVSGGEAASGFLGLRANARPARGAGLIVRPPLFRPEWADEGGPSTGNESIGRTPT
jgi:hypothetical protein